MSLATVQDRDHFVYRAFDASGQLLYVGCSIDVKKRLTEHARTTWRPLMDRIDVEGPYSYAEGRRREWQAIQTEEPSHNGQTPTALARRLAHSRFVEDFIGVAMSHGETFSGAAHQAVTALDIEIEEGAL